MASSINEALQKAGLGNTKTEKQHSKTTQLIKVSNAFPIRSPFSCIHSDFLYKNFEDFLHLEERSFTSDIIVSGINLVFKMLKKANKEKRLFIMKKEECRRYCCVWIAWNRKYNRFVLRGNVDWKLSDLPIEMLKNANIRKLLLDDFSLKLTSDISEFQALSKKESSAVIATMFENFAIPVVVEYTDFDFVVNQVKPKNEPNKTGLVVKPVIAQETMTEVFEEIKDMEEESKESDEEDDPLFEMAEKEELEDMPLSTNDSITPQGADEVEDLNLLPSQEDIDDLFGDINSKVNQMSKKDADKYLMEQFQQIQSDFSSK